MRKIFFLAILTIILYSCSDEGKKVVEKTYPDGSPKVEKYYKIKGSDSELVKEVNYYSSQQKMMEGKYKNDKRDGYWVYYYENGEKWSEGIYENGLDEGLRTTYYENGEKRYEGNYTKGKETGIWKFWNEKGKLEKTINYDTVKTKK